MKLSELIRKDFKIEGNVNIEVNSIKFNSKEINEKDVFVAIRGQNKDGHDFIDEALKNGAVAIVYEKKHYKPFSHDNIVWIGVDESRDALAWLSSKFYGCPSKNLHLIGITGTNGKTTTSYLIREILKKNGKKTGLIGTIKYFIDEDEITAPHTTPESLQFQKLLWEMLQKGVEYVISEV